MDKSDTVRPGLLETLHRSSAIVLAVLQNRLELLATDLEEERLRLFNALLLTSAVVALGFVTLALAAGALVIVFWSELGVTGLVALSGLSLVITLLACWRLRLRLRNWPLLSGTLAELKKDRACLENKT